MADIVNVGIAGRVYVRFFDSMNPLDSQALIAFRRAGARLDRERNLWFVGEHRRDDALRACIDTGGDISGDANPDGMRSVPVGGIDLKSGWVLTAADDRAVWFVNPYANAFSDDRGAVIMPVDQAWHLAEHSPREDQRNAFCELLEVYNALPRLKVRPAFTDAKRDAPRIEPDPPGVPPERDPNAATDKQRKAIDNLLVKLSRYDSEQADRLRGKLERLGGFALITKGAASGLISEIGNAIDQR